jgi:hypothetical protein
VSWFIGFRAFAAVDPDTRLIRIKNPSPASRSSRSAGDESEVDDGRFMVVSIFDIHHRKPT